MVERGRARRAARAVSDPPAHLARNGPCLTFQSRTPLFSLNDQFGSAALGAAARAGSDYGRKRLRGLIERTSLDRVRRNVAVVEWFPYHSQHFDGLRPRRPPYRARP